MSARTQSVEAGGIALDFRPKSYFWPLGLETHLLSRIKGAERKAALRWLIDSGRLEDIPDLLARSALSPGERTAMGRIHPGLMGGEYLPDLMSREVMVARIAIASTTQDVTCVYARRTKHRIHYRVVDEYAGGTLSGRTTRTSVRPLTLGELESFFTGAWSIFEVLDANFADGGYDLEAMQSFVVSIDSEFYPDLDALYRHRIVAWVAQQAGPDFPYKSLEVMTEIGAPHAPEIHLAITTLAAMLRAVVEGHAASEQSVRIAALRSASEGVLMSWPFELVAAEFRMRLRLPVDVAPDLAKGNQSTDWLGAAAQRLRDEGIEVKPDFRRQATSYGWVSIRESEIN